MAEGNERSGKSYGGGHKGYGDRRPGNRGGKGFKPRGKGGFKPRHDGEGFKPRRREDGEGYAPRRDGDGEGHGGYRKSYGKSGGFHKGGRSGFGGKGGYRGNGPRRDGEGFKPRRAGDVATNYAACDKARTELGWVAQYDLNRMCADSWRWKSMNPDGYATK